MNRNKEIIINENKGNECKGLIFRASVNSFIEKKGNYVYQERMILLKRKSCSGCEDCDWIKENFEEMVADEHFPIIQNIRHGCLYTLIVTYENDDDDYELEFIPYKLKR